MVHAFVLHTIAYKDTSLIVKFFTKEHGIVNLIANGAKRRRSKFLGILRSFLPLLIYWKTKGSNIELAPLYSAEVAGLAYKLEGKDLFSGLYINELLLKLLVPQDPTPELFMAYQEFLAKLTLLNSIFTQTWSLDQRKLNLQQNLRIMEKQILKAIGYELQLDLNKHNRQTIDPEGRYYFDYEDGVKLYNATLETKVSTQHNLSTLSGKDLLALYDDQITSLTQMRAIKLFMREILNYFLGGKLLAVRGLFE